MSTVAALYVEPGGIYYGLRDVDPWDEARDARLYNGPHPVVAHPPCARWSRLAGFTEARFGYKRGEDAGCFKAALDAVHTYGGVIEHPAYSAAWAKFGLPKPTWYGGWTLGLEGGASCYVEQGRYGLPVKKATWLYAYGVDLPELRWGRVPDNRGDQPNGAFGGIDHWRDRWAKPTGLEDANSWWEANRHNGLRSATPPAFRDVLLSIARSAARTYPCPACNGAGLRDFRYGTYEELDLYCLVCRPLEGAALPDKQATAPAKQTKRESQSV